MRLKLNILLITLLALFSCAKERGERGSDDQGTGTLYVRFDVPANAGVTKVDGVSGGGYDGTHNVLKKEKDDTIRHGRLFLVDNKDNKGIVVAYRKAVDNENGVIGHSSGTEVITGIKRGDYKLYVFVNGSKEQAEIFDKAYPNPHKLSIDDLLKTKLSGKDLEGGKSPTFADKEGIPCTFVTDVAITAGNNYVDAHLERCVGRLTIKVLNNIPDRKLAIRSIGLSADNPTNGYYFPSSSAVTKGAFPELEGVIEFAPNENKTIFDHYVYETDVVAEGLSFDLFGAVYGSGANVVFEEIQFGQDIKSGWSPQTGEIYLLKSAASQNYYIGDLDGEGKLGCSANSDDIVFAHRNDVKNYLWEVSVDNPGKSAKYTFKNVGTKKFIKLNKNTLSLVESDGTGFSVPSSTSTDGYSFYENQWTGVWMFPKYDNYYMTYNPGDNSLSGSTTNNDLNTKWILRKVEPFNEGGFIKSEVAIPRKNRPIKIVDKYGDAQLLQQIKRNEHVTVSINIFYNRELGEFDFKVSSWKEISNETTFD